MPETSEKCTCGAVLVENARFCHRCGRPTSELIAAEEQDAAQIATIAQPAPEATAPPPPPPPIGFSNPIALRVAFLMSLGVLLASMLPVVNVFILVWCLPAGWGAVRIYGRLTGQRLSTSAGARLGFITGLFAFVILTVFITFAMVTQGKEILNEVTAQMLKQNPGLKDTISDPAMLGAAMMMMMVMIFAMVTGICAAGGALGAKLSGTERKG